MAMQRLNYSIDIRASRAQVWRTLWNDVTYRKWTSVFSEGSYAVSEWQEGSKVLFLNPEGGGMSSVIAKMKAEEFMSFRHMGVVKGGEEFFDEEETRDWAGSTEDYTLREVEGGTTLTVEMDIDEKHRSYFEETFPKALEIVKTLSEEA
jgi:hypothetical protein